MPFKAVTLTKTSYDDIKFNATKKSQILKSAFAKPQNWKSSPQQQLISKGCLKISLTQIQVSLK